MPVAIFIVGLLAASVVIAMLSAARELHSNGRGWTTVIPGDTTESSLDAGFHRSTTAPCVWEARHPR